MPPTGLVPHPVIDPSRAQTMLTVLTQIPRFVSGNWVEATAAGLYPAILEGALVTRSSRKIPPMKESAMNTWTVAAAKAKFSEVIELARSRGPQTITRNGRTAVVIVAAEEWERKTSRVGNVAEFRRFAALGAEDHTAQRSSAKDRDRRRSKKHQYRAAAPGGSRCESPHARTRASCRI
jgi:prevent-host-death family protein